MTLLSGGDQEKLKDRIEQDLGALSRLHSLGLNGDTCTVIPQIPSFLRAHMPEEIKSMLEVGFEYMCEKEGLLFFRKRK